MNKSEKKFLFNEKRINEVPENEAWRQINSLDHAEKVFISLCREKKCLEKEILKLRKDNETLKKKNFDLEFNKISKPKEERPVGGSILHLKRLINHMEVGKRYTRKDLASEFLMSIKEIEEWMKIIQIYKIMQVDFDGTAYIRK